MSTPQPALAAELDLEPDQMVGEYRVEGKLGQGAFGTVFKATHPLIGKVVAIKVLARRYSVDPEIVSRFMAEARAVNQIRHRNIIDIFSFGQLDDGRMYYVMEYLDGEPLDALLDRARNLSLSDALPILRGIAKALDAAHGKGICHRDLKAENVFLATDPDDGGAWPKLLDFGIAKLLAPEEGLKHKTRTGAPIGTPYYMSPEQCRGKDVDHRTDIYAFGVLVYRMLAGVYPFDADDYMTILFMQINDEPPPLTSHLPDLPTTIDDCVAWLLAKDPARRPPDLRTAVRALEHAAQDAGFDIGPVSAWDVQNAQTQPPRRSDVSRVAVPLRSAISVAAIKRSRAPIAIVLLALVVAAAAGGYLYWQQQQAEPAFVAFTPPRLPAPQPSPTPPARAPVPAPKPATVIIDVSGAPEGTEVAIAGDVVGAAPGPVQLPQGTSPIVLTFRADGYASTSREIVPNADQALAIALKKKKQQPAAKKASTKDQIIDVFGEKK